MWDVKKGRGDSLEGRKIIRLGKGSLMHPGTKGAINATRGTGCGRRRQSRNRIRLWEMDRELQNEGISKRESGAEKKSGTINLKASQEASKGRKSGLGTNPITVLREPAGI